MKDLKKDLTRQQIDAKIQSFHVNDLKTFLYKYITCRFQKNVNEKSENDYNWACFILTKFCVCGVKGTKFCFE